MPGARLKLIVRALVPLTTGAPVASRARESRPLVATGKSPARAKAVERDSASAPDLPQTATNPISRQMALTPRVDKECAADTQ